MNPIARLLRCLAALGAALTGLLSAHQVDTVEFEFQRLENAWRLHGEMDIAYMLPETRWVPDSGPLSRLEVMKAPPEELQRIRKETEKTLRQFLHFTFGGEPLRWRIEFPDFEKEHFELPEEFADWALMTVRLVVDPQPGPGELSVHWSEKEKAELIILTEDSEDGEIVSLQPGGKLSLLTVADSGEQSVSEDTKAFRSWVVSGFRHVVPLGYDHMLFIFGLFVAVLKLRPMLWQSLLFTLSHSLTLALCALGWVSLDARLVEILIALSIAVIGLEDLFRCKVGLRRYLMVFTFGLIHGMGFANVLAEQVRGIPHAQLVQPLLGFNLGVEVGQIAVIVVSATLFLMIRKKRKKSAQTIGSLVVAISGIGWMVERIWFA